MKTVSRKILRHAVLLLTVLTLTAFGIRTAVRRSAEHEADALPASAAADTVPVIVLDAGHGESTETKFGRIGERLLNRIPINE